MTFNENPYFNQAVRRLANVAESNRFFLAPYVCLAARKNPLPKGLRAVRQGQPEPLEIESLVHIFVEAIAPALGYRVRRGQLPQLRQAIQKHFQRRRGVSWPKVNQCPPISSIKKQHGLA